MRLASELLIRDEKEAKTILIQSPGRAALVGQHGGGSTDYAGRRRPVPSG